MFCKQFFIHFHLTILFFLLNMATTAYKHAPDVMASGHYMRFYASHVYTLAYCAGK